MLYIDLNVKMWRFFKSRGTLNLLNLNMIGWTYWTKHVVWISNYLH